MPKVTEIFAFVMADKDNEDEGIIGAEMPHPTRPGEKMFMPFVGADMKRVASLRPLADSLRRTTGKNYKILHFKLAGEI